MKQLNNKLVAWDSETVPQHSSGTLAEKRREVKI